jgi:DNA-binding HxlR family transcriptional regulator
METIEFRGNVYSATCPTRQILDHIVDKWTPLVIALLEDKTMRFSELQHRINGISQKMLTQTLRNLERDGLVTRTVYAEVPPRVEYALTPLGQTLAEPLRAILDWAETHVRAIGAAQRQYDERESG